MARRKRPLKFLIMKLIPFELRMRLQEASIKRSYKLELEKDDSSRNKESIEYSMFFELSEFDELRKLRYSRRLLRKARKLIVPTPPVYKGNEPTKYWDMGKHTFKTYLTIEGIDYTRNSIRKEEQWRINKRKNMREWLLAITALIGSLIGLVSVSSQAMTNYFLRLP